MIQLARRDTSECEESWNGLPFLFEWDVKSHSLIVADIKISTKFYRKTSEKEFLSPLKVLSP